MCKKSCENCYWNDNKGECEKAISNRDTCTKHNFLCNECGYDMAKYKMNDKYFCEDCFLEEFNVEEVMIKAYYYDGRYLGNEEDDDNESLADTLLPYLYEDIDRLY